MNPFKKLKKLFGVQTDDAPSSPNPLNQTKHYQAPQDLTIVDRILAWIDTQQWKYEYRPSTDDLGIHHVILGFTDNEHDWTCVFRIHEKNHLVSIFGILDSTVPVSHYTAILMAFTKANLTISYGSLELDPHDGEIRAKLAFDGEFTHIHDKSLGCYMQAVAGLTELARTIVSEIMVDDNPSQFSGDYLEVSDEVVAKIGGDKQTFFVPTQKRQ